MIEFAPHLTVELHRQHKSGLQAHSRWLPLLAATAIAGFFLMRNIQDNGERIRNADSLGSVAIATMLLKASSAGTLGPPQSSAPILSFKPTHSPAKEAFQVGDALVHVSYLVGSGSPTPPPLARLPLRPPVRFGREGLRGLTDWNRTNLRVGEFRAAFFRKGKLEVLAIQGVVELVRITGAVP